MDCKYYEKKENGCVCKLASEMVTREIYIFCEERKHSPCKKCKEENPNPSKDNPTPTVLHQIKISNIQLPKITEQAKNYTEAMVGFVTSGFQTVPEDVYNNRLEICKDCDYYEDNRCKLCGCKLAGESGFTSKLKMAHEQCPHNPPKWEKYSKID